MLADCIENAHKRLAPDARLQWASNTHRMPKKKLCFSHGSHTRCHQPGGLSMPPNAMCQKL